MKNSLYILIFVTAFFACNNSSKTTKSTNKKSDLEIKEKVSKIIFFTVISETDVTSPVSFTIPNQNLLKSNNNILYSKNDTIRVTINQFEFVEVHNKYMLIDSIIVQQGDTLVLRFEKNKLKKTIYNKKRHLPLKANYKHVIDSSFSSYLKKFRTHYFNINYTNPLELENDFSKIIIYPISVNKNAIERDIDLIIKTYDSLLVEYQKTSKKKYSDIRENIYNDLFFNLVFNDLVGIYKTYNNPKLLNYLFSKSFSQNYINSSNQYSIFSKLMFDVLYEDLKDKSSSKTMYNISYIYDDLPNKIHDPEFLKKFRIVCLEEMIQQGSPLEKVIEVFEKFNAFYLDLKFKNYFETAYLVDLKKRYKATNELNLLNVSGEVINFNELKNKLKGNVIYVDLWASWCAPCRQSMPASRKLLNEIKESKNIVILYFSIDKNRNSWAKASKVEKIESYTYNYLILNTESSNFMRSHKIKSIPRYLIFDTNGNLVEDNAAGPKSKTLKETLINYSEFK